MQVDSDSEMAEIDEMTNKPDVQAAIALYYEDMQYESAPHSLFSAMLAQINQFSVLQSVMWTKHGCP